MTEYAWIVAATVFLIWLWNVLYTIKEGERGVVMRLGKVQAEPLAPGLRIILWPVDTLYRVSVEPQTLAVAAQTLRARGDVDIPAGATCNFRVVDVVRAITQVLEYRSALEKLAAECMRQAVGQFSVEEVLYAPAAMNQQIKKSLEEMAREWGLEILSFEMQSETH